ncbi:ABC transporter permease subunit [Halobellus sp. GM3]|uniref:ABC transporter permease subunit n=1 Tax=Halobellus sp. GM3 TaxID=3458410 RepID=UPI00403DA17A
MSTIDQQTDEETAPETRKVGGREVLRKVKRDFSARIGMYIIAVVVAVAAFSSIDAHLSTITGGMLENYAIGEALPVLQNPERLPAPGEMETHRPPAFVEGGTWEHPLGTDDQGRDYLSRLLYGSRISITAGIVATAIGAVGGIAAGTVGGYFGGWVDDVTMRAVETIYAIPAVVLVIVFTVFVSRRNPNIWFTMTGVGIVSIPVFARVIRSRVLSIRELSYIEAAKASGVKERTIILRHVIPNSFAPVLVYITLRIGVVILIVAGLSFLGYGVQPPTPDWGQMLYMAQQNIYVNPWLSIWPGLSILVTIMGFNLLGDGLQDATDPRND